MEGWVLAGESHAGKGLLWIHLSIESTTFGEVIFVRKAKGWVESGSASQDVGVNGIPSLHSPPGCDDRVSQERDESYESLVCGLASEYIFTITLAPIKPFQ